MPPDDDGDQPFVDDDGDSLPWTTMATSLLLTDDGPEFSVISPYLAHC
jgi:hypothetical protein